MAKKSKVKHGSKAAFVRENPSVSASDLVKLGQKQGLKLTVGHIYNIRATDKAKLAPGGRPSSSAAPVAVAAGSDSPRLESQLRTLILRIGLDRADQIFSNLRGSLSNIA